MLFLVGNSLEICRDEECTLETIDADVAEPFQQLKQFRPDTIFLAK
jgi:hypothetical protein